VVEQSDFLWPEKAACVEGELVETFLREARARDEGGRMRREWRERE